MIYENVLDSIGETPLVKIKKVCGINADVYAKLEYFNPAGSIKDRVAKCLIEDGETRGKINKNTVIIEPTSGNTGIGLAMVCAVRGYRLILTMPDTLSNERKQILSGFGAELVLTPGADGMMGAIKKAESIAIENPNSFIPGQFSNPVVPLLHYHSTATEIWRDSKGRIDILIAGVGTGGTLSGSAMFLKKCKPSIKIIAVEPYNSSVISQTFNNKEINPNPHCIQGIGAGFIPDNLYLPLIDDVVRVKDDDALYYMRKLMRKEGIFAGITTGAAAYAALKISERKESKGKTIVFIAPDTGERYLSEGIFEKENSV